ncbi:MAG: NifB/NifX family molybdenum-iron cluster-binding protein [Phycisphaerales bacterium]|nr:NifB/NifX family molybdenum-iron cluster-binding protein [Phycisphaerales bacterium]
MKIGISVENGSVSGHFGHCPTFAVYELNDGAEVGAPTIHQAPPHERGVLPRWLRDLGVDVIVTGGMGRHALALCGELGMQVILGVAEESPADVVERFRAGVLTSGANTCDH